MSKIPTFADDLAKRVRADDLDLVAGKFARELLVRGREL